MKPESAKQIWQYRDPSDPGESFMECCDQGLTRDQKQNHSRVTLKGQSTTFLLNVYHLKWKHIQKTEISLRIEC